MTKRMMFGALAMLLAAGGWLLWQLYPGELQAEPPEALERADAILDRADVLRTVFVTVGELQGGGPAGETLMIRWGAAGTGDHKGMEVAWQITREDGLVWGEAPLALTWVIRNDEGRQLVGDIRDQQQGARFSGGFRELEPEYTFGRYVACQIPLGATLTAGCCREQTATGSQNLYRAELFLSLGDKQLDAMLTEF